MHHATETDWLETSWGLGNLSTGKIFGFMVNILTEKMAARNAKSRDAKIVDKFIHPLLYFEFHKNVFNRSGIKLLETVMSCCALTTRRNGYFCSLILIRNWIPVANEANYTMASWESLALLKDCDKGSDWFIYMQTISAIAVVT